MHTPVNTEDLRVLQASQAEHKKQAAARTFVPPYDGAGVDLERFLPAAPQFPTTLLASSTTSVAVEVFVTWDRCEIE